ncbi:MAG: ACT domain-containing protein [Planctomycetes bacterium]|nr:ACT domain-containing protein [Planctomycetota bacterium]
MDAPGTSFRFRVHPERLAIARLERAATVPAWARGGFVTVSHTIDELSITCPQAHVPPDVVHERDKVALGIAGVIPMTTVGVLASLCAALAEADVPVFVISTHDTDWLLVSAGRFEAARAALSGLGHVVDGSLPAR